ncbi:MAG: T9SS type A sorting domain-containing protein [Candidatus Goldbacteria bacterium]|nr:T9SS type A sorting domain-containing protein [Candidatus Goldiibacteriota bacterium]
MRLRQNKKRLSFTMIFFAFLCFSLFAEPKIYNLTMTPSNPNFGEEVTISFDLCIGQYVNPANIVIAVSSFSNVLPFPTNGQVLVVSSWGVGVNTLGQSGADAGYNGGSGPDWDGPFDCTDCGGSASSASVHHSFKIKIPDANNFPGCDVKNLYLHVGAKNYYFGSTEWAGLNGNCNLSTLSWTIPVPPADFTIHKKAEGVAQNDGDLILYTIDYTYGNGRLTITDNLPAGNVVRFVKAGPGIPVLTSAPSAGDTSGPITWTFPDRTGIAGIASGSVWFLVSLVNPPATPGTKITNVAQGNMPSSGTKTSSVDVTVGQAAMTIKKYQNEDSLSVGQTITYTLEYEINGSNMKSYNSFDELTTGTRYGDAGEWDSSVGPGNGSPPPGFISIPYGTDEGVWEVVEPCGSGDKYLRGSASANQHYPGLLLAGPDNNFCTGQIVTDVMIEPAGYEGSDVQIIIRHNGMSGSNSYSIGLILSIDNTPGKLSFQKVAAGGIPTWHVPNNTVDIVGYKWYRVRVDVQQTGAYYTLKARVWPKGDPEPNVWHLISTTDFPVDDTWRCDGLGTYNNWRPGINEQRGDSNVKNSFDNFVIYEPRTNANATLFDTIPAGIDYAGSAGPLGSGSINSGIIRWNLGSIANESGSYTWWGTINNCGTITNQAGIGSTSSNPVFSNVTSLNVLCGTPTITPTITMTSTDTNTPTQTNTPTNTPTITPTFTPAPAQLEIILQAVDTSVSSGGYAEIRMIVKNTGGIVAQDILLTQEIPSLTSFDKNYKDNVNWTQTATSIQRNVGDLNPGDVIYVTYFLKTDENLPDGQVIKVQPADAEFNLYPSPFPVVRTTVYSNEVSFTVGKIFVYPNPFYPDKASGGAVKFINLPKNTKVIIYTVSGEMVQAYKNVTSTILWDARNIKGKLVSTGIYYYVISWEHGEKKKTGKIFVINQ